MSTPGSVITIRYNYQRRLVVLLQTRNKGSGLVGCMEQLHVKVAQAIHVLNHDNQSSNRFAANQWLLQFQQTDAAWQIAASFLTSDLHHPFISDYEVQFFAAQILKRKVLPFLLLLQ